MDAREVCLSCKTSKRLMVVAAHQELIEFRGELRDNVGHRLATAIVDSITTIAKTTSPPEKTPLHG